MIKKRRIILLFHFMHSWRHILGSNNFSIDINSFKVLVQIHYSHSLAPRLSLIQLSFHVFSLIITYFSSYYHIFKLKVAFRGLKRVLERGPSSAGDSKDSFKASIGPPSSKAGALAAGGPSKASKGLGPQVPWGRP